MSHPQAFYTSCRSGLGGQPGFQFNAASPVLDRAALARLAAVHAGYHVPRDMPLEPDAADLARFPVALKAAPVDGLGPVVSRTVYVGREYRGRDGEPDEGRFGNYFSHIVVGDGDDPFDGLLAVELWDAPHWNDSESTDPGLAEIGSLAPGPLDLERAAGLLRDVPDALMAAVLDAAAEALDGGARVVLIDGDHGRAAAWIAWISFALPTAHARRLTFTTFDGRPRYVDDVHVCVATPACDTAFAAHEIGSSVRVLDVGAPVPRGRPSLYARTALALMREGPEALATAVHAISDEPSGTDLGARLAVAGGTGEFVEADELAAVVDLLRQLADAGRIERAAAMARQLPADATVDRAALFSLAALHRTARRQPAGEDARSIAETALARLVPFAGELPEEIGTVAPDSPTQPAVGNLAAWLGAVEAAAGTARSGALISDGLRLGLAGVNAAVDRRLVPVLLDGLEHDPVRQVMRLIGERAALEPILVAMTESLAERPLDDASAQEHLRWIGRYPAARETLRRRAHEQPSFQRLLAWRQCEIERDRALRARAASELVSLATGEVEHAAIRALWGPDGPTDARGHLELLGAYLDHALEPPWTDVSRALAELMTHPFDSEASWDPLGRTLARSEQPRAHPSYLAWSVVAFQPGVHCRFARWAADGAAALAADAREVPEERQRELRRQICRELVEQRHVDDYAEGIAALRAHIPQRLADGLVEYLTRWFRRGHDNARLVAELFRRWRQLPDGDGDVLVDDVLARAAEPLKRRDLELVEKLLDRSLRTDWQAWLEHGSRPGGGRALGRRRRRARDGGRGG